MKIVLLDDHPMMLKSITQTVGSIPDFELLGAFDSAEKLRSYVEHFHREEEKLLALVDLQIGANYSFNLINELSKKGIICAVYSMYSQVPFVVKAFQNGAKGYIFKNYSEENFIDALKILATGEPFIPPEITAAFARTSSIFASLTKKEQQVAELIMRNFSNKEISEELNIGKRTTENYLARLYDKTGCSSRIELERYFQGRNGTAKTNAEGI
ncbi:MAG: response regulator transcription factor [Treponema sp.]|nr:response regulator transcription factor [Candidatus Treponema equifaecale]